MANALITASFFKHNENILANTEGRPPNPVSAYNGLFTDMGSTEFQSFDSNYRYIPSTALIL